MPVSAASPRRQPSRPQSRGQSSVIGTALLFSFVVIASIAIVGVGTITLTETQQQTRVEHAAQSLSQFDAAASQAAFATGPHNTQYVDLGLKNTEHVTTDDSGRMWVQTIDDTSGTVNDTLLNQQLGAVVYHHTNTPTTIAYQGGGVWRADPTANTSRMVSPPELHYQDQTLTLPLVVLNDSGSVDRSSGGGLTVSRDKTTAVYPTPSKQNPLNEKVIRVRVQSPYYEGWAQFFRTRVGGTVTVNHTTQNATVMLETPDKLDTVPTGLASTAPGSGVTIRGGGRTDSFVDSYDSRDGDYSTTQSSNGNITATNDVDLAGGGFIEGNVIVPPGYTVRQRGNAYVSGEVIHKELELPSSTTALRDTARTAETANDNAATPAITETTLNARQTTWTLNQSGTYYLDQDLVLDSGEELRLNTTSGNLTVVVTGDVILNGGTINVTNATGHDTASARLYMLGDDVELSSGTVTVPNHASDRFWIYGRTGLNVEMRQSSFTGVIYAPDDGSGTVELRANTHVYGGLVGGQAVLRSGAAIHYDQALTTSKIMPGTIRQPVTYLHITTAELSVADDTTR